MRPSQVFQTLETLRDSPSVTFSRKGVLLSQDDGQTVSDVYLMWLCLMIDLGYLPPEGFLRTARRLWHDMCTVDVFDLITACAECQRLVYNRSTVGFKGNCSVISRHLYPLVRGDVEALRVSDVSAAKRLVQIFGYMTRLSLADIDLTQQMLDDYLDIEMSIKDVFPDNVTNALNKIIRRWFGTTVPGEIVPRHGRGGVAGLGRCSIQRKYLNLFSDPLLSHVFGVDDWWVPRGNRGIRLDRCSETIFVPKSYKSFRTISMEPCTLQYLQQGVWRLIEGQVKRSKYLRDHIGFEEQDRNRRLAQQGSIFKNYSTIDLSSASDSVSYNLVKKLFHKTWLLPYIMATRSRETVLPNGVRMTLKKFAPMGSSLCFPIETIIFASICEHVTQVNHFSADYSVYGDDIIVPTDCTASVIRLLGHLGFKVNMDKTFGGDTWFRESCGGEYCDGFDVTPMRVSRKYAHRDDNERYVKMISKANEAYVKGFLNLRHFYLAKLRKMNPHVLFSPVHLVADNYTNYHLQRRWNPRFQKFEVKTVDLKAAYSSKDPKEIDEEIRLRYWLESCYLRHTVVIAFCANISRPMVVFRETWVEKPDESFDQALVEFYTQHLRYCGDGLMEWSLDT